MCLKSHFCLISFSLSVATLYMNICIFIILRVIFFQTIVIDFQ